MQGEWGRPTRLKDKLHACGSANVSPLVSSSSQTYYKIGAKVLQTHPKTNTNHMGKAFVLSINASFSIQCGGLRPALSSHLFVDLMGSNTWACHGVWWWIIRTWHVITCHYILPYTIVYCILPTYLSCSSSSIMGGPLFLPPSTPCGPSWPTAMGGLSDCSRCWISQRLAGSATGHLPMRMRRLRASQAQPPANIKLKPSWNRLITDRYFLLVLSTCIP